MDSFTERMLKRVEERRKVLDQKLAAADLHITLSTPGKHESHKTSQKEIDGNNDSSGSNDEYSDLSSKDSSLNEKENTIPQSGLRFEARKRLKKLGALYSDNIAISSPVQQTEQKFNAIDTSPGKTSTYSAALNARLAALAETINQREDDFRHVSVKKAQGFARCESHSNLAYDYSKESTKLRKERSPIKHEIGNHNSKNRPNRGRSPVKEMIESYNKIDSDVAKDTQRTTPIKTTPKREESKPEQKYRSPVRMGIGRTVDSVCDKQNQSSCSVSPAMGIRQLLSPHSSNHGSVLQKAALFETKTSPIKKVQTDPAELPLSQRKALFEQNAGAAVLPKAPFALPVPPSMLQDNKEPIMLPATPINSCTTPVCKRKIINNSDKGEKAGVDSVVAKFETERSLPQTSTKLQVQRGITERQRELDMLRNRWNHCKTISHDPSEDSGESVSSVPIAPPLPNNPPQQKTVTFSHETIINRFSYSTEETTSTEPDDSVRQSFSPEREYPGLKGVKEIKVSPPKPGHLYPNLSDIDTESDIPPSDFDEFVDGLSDEHERFESTSASSSMSEESFGQQIMQVANRSMSDSTLRTLKRDLSMSSSTNSDMSEESIGNSDLNRFLDEALCESENEPTPPKRLCSDDNFDQNLNSLQSESFEYSRARTSSNEKTDSSLPSYLIDGDSHVPLTHTVSFYRKQTMNHKPLSPRRYFLHQSLEEDGDTSEEDICQQQEAVEKRIAELEQEVSRQQIVMSQASQALNLCSSTIEFSGSTEEVEGERLLLVATQRRQSALHEIQRLRVEGSLRPLGRDNSRLTERGDLTVSEVTLPLKLDNIRAAAREEKSYHILCLVKSGSQVLSTTMMAAMPRNLHNNNKLTFPSSLTLCGLYSDFKVTIEVYGMSSRSKEILPHDIKYHISTSKKDTCKLKLTPKKNRHDDKLVRPNLQSPGGPGAVRTPKFSLMGYVVFSLREINRTHFTLNKVPYTSILEGSIEINLSCQMSIDIEHRAFLTMFGLGAWYRRWCLLKGDKLSFWMYPDDEKKKIPIDTIDLATCITEEVGVVPRDICARPHTFLLETSRPIRDDDKPSLIFVRNGNETIVRHLLSADTKNERLEWCEHLNKALALLRAWGKK